VKLHARMLFEEISNELSFVGREVVEDDMSSSDWRKRCFQRMIVGALVCSRRLMVLKELPSASIKTSLARKTQPAGRERD